MSNNNVFRGVGNFFETMASAIAVSQAVRQRRYPANNDLDRLGINPKNFRQIKF